MAKGSSSGSSLMGSWGAGGGSNQLSELSRAGLTPAQANSLGINLVGPGQQPTSGVLGSLSNLTSGFTQGLAGNQGPGIGNSALQTLGGVAGSRFMGGNPTAMALQGVVNMAGQVPFFQGIPQMSVTGPATKPPPEAVAIDKRGRLISVKGFIAQRLGGSAAALGGS